MNLNRSASQLLSTGSLTHLAQRKDYKVWMQNGLVFKVRAVLISGIHDSYQLWFRRNIPFIGWKFLGDCEHSTFIEEYISKNFGYTARIKRLR